MSKLNFGKNSIIGALVMCAGVVAVHQGVKTIKEDVSEHKYIQDECGANSCDECECECTEPEETENTISGETIM